MSQNYKFQILESLRGYMAWWVVLGHGLQLSGFWTTKEVAEFFNGSEGYYRILEKGVNLLLHAGSAVNVFIILSGFVITHLLLVKNESYKNFIFRRFFRLAPALYVCLILAILFLDFYKIAYTELSFAGDTSMRLSRIAEQENNFLIHVINHLALIHSLFPQEILPFSPTTFLAPAWSIGLEWQFYLLAPLLVLYLRRSQNSIIAVTILLIGARYFIQHFSGLHWQYNSFFFKVPDYFLVGILSRLIIDRIHHNKQFADLALLTVLLLLLQDSYSTFIWLFISGVIFYEMGYLNIESSFLKKTLSILFFNNIITSVGRWSYSTYLIHIPIFSLLVGGYAYFTNPQDITRQTVLIILLISFPIILVLSSVMYRYVEAPAMNYISLKLKQRQLQDVKTGAE
jgi:peptidoglycan/LPS O-acetylase OafA/YrhL